MPQTRSRVKRQRICPWCSQSFSKEEHLARHIRSHTKEKPFGCATCGKSFSRHDSLLRHARSHQSASISSETPTGPDHSALNIPSVSYGAGSDSLPHLPGTTSSFGTAANEATSSLFSPTQHPAVPSSDSTLAQPRLPGWLETIVQSPNFGRHEHANSQSASFGALDGIFQEDPSMQWNLNLDSQVPTWLADEDFDLNALNSSVMATTMSYLSPLNTRSEIDPLIFAVQPPDDPIMDRKEDQVRQRWFTFIGTHDPGYLTPDAIPEQTEVDERYRENLSQRLQQRVPTEPLPSTDFLNLCIQMYFTRFNPIFPVVHAPTFRPSAKSSLLLLSICSVGSLFVGSNYAVAQGSRIFERLNKAILASWEKYLSRGRGEALAMTQAALIGQTFGMLSGKPRNLLIVQTFHGTVVTWARRYKMFQVHQATDQLQVNSLTHTAEEVWKSWAHAEEQIRVAAGLYILDSEVSELFMIHPFMQHAESTLPLTASNELWVSPTAAQWKATMNSEQSSARPDIPLVETSDQSPEQPRSDLDMGSSSRFRQYTKLQGIVASIMEKRTSPAAWTDKTCRQFEKQLIQFFDQHLKSKTQSRTDPFCLEILWHSTFMSLFVDFNRLELVMGRDGYDESVPHRDYVYKWASSHEGHRCALHGALILRKLQSMALGMEPAIHVPRALYRAAIVWYAYSEFGVDEQHMGTSTTPSMDFPELARLNVNSQILLFEANGYKSTKPKTQESSTLCGLIDLLRRIGHWGLSRKFAEQIVFVLQGNRELEAQVEFF